MLVQLNYPMVQYDFMFWLASGVTCLRIEIQSSKDSGEKGGKS